MRGIIYIGLALLLPVIGFSAWIGPDSVVSQRLKKIERRVPLEFNGFVREAIQLHGNDRAADMQAALNRASGMIKEVEETLSTMNLPDELKFLPLVLSHYDNAFHQPKGGTGIWKLNYLTAVRNGLFVNEWVDQRKDYKAATLAAAQYFKSLDDIYHSWQLDLLAFVTSPAIVNTAMERAGTNLDFWRIYQQIPDESKAGYTAFIAAVYIYHFPQDFGLSVPASITKEPMVEVKTKGVMYFDDLAVSLGLGVSRLKNMNPVFYAEKIPADAPFPLVIPADLATTFVQAENQVYAKAKNRESVVITDTKTQHIILPAEDILTDDAGDEGEGGEEEPEIAAGGAKKSVITSGASYHTVTPGETMFKLAQKYQVTVDELKTWNNRSDDKVYAGEKLIVGTEAGVKALATEIKSEPVVKKTAKTTSSEAETYVTYKVKSGDSLWGIAGKYTGVSDTDIKALNNLKSDTIYPGQVLKIKKQ